jgi:hypothetical protein
MSEYSLLFKNTLTIEDWGHLRQGFSNFENVFTAEIIKISIQGRIAAQTTVPHVFF